MPRVDTAEPDRTSGRAPSGVIGAVRAFAGTLAAVVLATGAAACSDDTNDTNDTVDADAVIGGGAESVSGATSRFSLPVGPIAVTVGRPTASLRADLVRDGRRRDAPAGSSFVPVHVEPPPVDRMPWAGLLAATPRRASVVLEAQGERRELGSPYRVGATGRSISSVADTTFYAVFPGRPDAGEITVTVRYDAGEQQAAAGEAPTGAGSTLAALTPDRPAPPSCPGTGWQVVGAGPRATARVACDLAVTGWTPYWPGRGWAPPGRPWLVVDVTRLQVQAVTVGGREVELGQAEAGGDVEGLGATDRGPGSLGGTVVLGYDEVRDATLDLEVLLTASPASGDERRALLVRRELVVPAPQSALTAGR
ncbi:hypothetical protein [Nocardioides sp.]|uniref:hypothetical protein n=1 Tax=Nocardioides sp. TaxID=35761 RepID=UPI0035153D4E